MLKNSGCLPLEELEEGEEVPTLRLLGSSLGDSSSSRSATPEV